MQQQTQRTTVKVAAGSTPAAAVAQLAATSRERDADDAMGRSRYCEPGLARLLQQAPEGISMTKGAGTEKTHPKR